MKKKHLLILFLMISFILSSLTVCKKTAADNDTVYQYSTINALLEGIFEGNLSLKELKSRGNFGIGTFNDLDGEMIELEGVFYAIKSDGKAYVMDDQSKTPFCVATDFDTDKTIQTGKSLDYKSLIQYLDEVIPSKNLFYAIKITGNFEYVKTRSVPKQNKPYPKLAEVTKNQPVFELNNTAGTLVGFRVPEFAKGINVPGYHFHYLDNDKKRGGHLLDFRSNNLNIEIDFSDDFFMDLPESGDFLSADISGEKEDEVKKVEK